MIGKVLVDAFLLLKSYYLLNFFRFVNQFNIFINLFNYVQLIRIFKYWKNANFY